MKALFVLAALLGLMAAIVPDASGDWASAQSPRGVRLEPNDFWYWHKPGLSANGKSPPLDNTDIVYDASHTLLWHYGDNYLNLPRAWAISRCETSSRPPVMASSDTEYMLTHYDMRGNIWRNKAELLGRPGIDDDGDGLVDITYTPSLYADSQIGSASIPWTSSMFDPVNPATLANGETHGTIVMSQVIAETNNEGWWVGREWSDYITELDQHQTGIPGIAWNAKFVGTGATVTMGGADCGNYMSWLADNGVNIKVFSYSVDGIDDELFSKLAVHEIALFSSAGNDNWTVNDCNGCANFASVSAVDADYHRSMWNYFATPIEASELGAAYREGAYGKKVDFVGYAPNYNDAWMYSGGTGKYVYYSGPEQALTLDRIDTRGFSDWSDAVATGTNMDKAELGVPGFADRAYGDPARLVTECFATSTLGTSGTSPQAAGVALLVFAKWPDLLPEQVISMMRRGAVNIDAFNTDRCCTGTLEQCVPYRGEHDTGSCAGYLGAGRLDAYRTLTLWGTVPADTTLSGDVYVSGDVLIKTGRTVTVAAGTRIYIAPDDITYLDPWNTENRYDMSGSTSDGNDYLPSQTNASKVQFRIEGTGRLVILGSPEHPVVFDSFVNDAQTASDWTGIDVVDGNSITHANGPTSIQILHSTNGEF